MFELLSINARITMRSIVLYLVIAFAITSPIFTAFHAKAANKYAAMVVDAKTGRVLFSRNANAARYPASLTKIMTLYMIFEELTAGRMSYNTPLKVSKHAAAQPPSKLGLKPGATISVKAAILALVTKSANDVAAVVAENIAGSETAFAKKMTRTAHSIGMRSTTFKNASGLPHPKQKTTARDMVRLGRAIQDRFPQHYKFFETRYYRYKGLKYSNHNRLLGRVKGVDGIKTGYTRASGFNLVTSVKRNNRYIVAVVMGGKTGRSRDKHMATLISKHIKKARRGNRTAPLLVARATTGKMIAPANRPMIKVAKNTPTEPVKTTIRIQTAHALTSMPMPKLAPDIEAISTHATAYAAPKSASSTATISVPSETIRHGWKIQIGAMPKKSAAKSLLTKAKTKAMRYLKDKTQYTESVEKNSATLWRARFAGFDSKKNARDTCNYLKKKKIACYTILN